MSALFDSARFVMSVSELMGLPETELPEIAFAGRSNAGKSTTINVLCRQSRLAFSSKTPGTGKASSAATSSKDLS